MILCCRDCFFSAIRLPFSEVRRTKAPHYQWQFNGKDLVDATNAWLTLSRVFVENAGVYRVMVSNAEGTAPSADAELVVTPPPVPPQLTINSQLEITIHGETGRTYSLEYTSGFDQDFDYWIVLTTLTLTNSTQSLIDPEAGNQPQRFYRAVVEPF